jgi:hypothetical protein
MRVAVQVIGGCAILGTSFFGALFVIDHYPRYSEAEIRDRQRASDAALIKTALEKYRAARGAYPILPDNSTDDLKASLVDGGFLPAVPHDPLSTQTYRYVSPDGSSYGLRFQLETATGKIPANGLCLTGLKTAGTGWYGQPPECPF